MAKKIPIIGVNVTSNIGGSVQPLGPVFGNGVASTDSLKSVVDPKPSIIYASSAEISAIISVVNEIISIRRLVLSDTYDASLIQEIVKLLVSKKFSDQVGPISDFITQIVFNKGLFSPAVPIDILARTVDFNRDFSDIEILLDKHAVDFSKILTDSTTPIDITGVGDGLAFDLSKVLTNLVGTSDNFSRVINFVRKPEDVIALSDVSTISATKGLKDTVNLDDSEIISFIKQLNDSVNPIDTTGVGDGLAFDLSKILVDLTNASDNFNRVVNFVRKPEDAIELNDKAIILANKGLSEDITLDDLKTIDFIKRPSETINVLEVKVVDLSKVLSEISIIQDLKLLEIIKPFADLFTVNDSDTINFVKGNFETITPSDNNVIVFAKALIETLQPLDLSVIDLEKILSDNVNTSDFDSIDFTKFNVDSISAESFTSLDTAKNLFESLSIEDENVLDFEKIAFDSITVDSISRFDFVKFIADTAIVEDLTNIFDGSNYEITKSVTDIVISDENFSRIVDFNRAFQDEQPINDFNTIDFSKILESFADGTDNQAITVDLVKTDSVIDINDVFNRVVEYSRSFSDDQTQSDSNIIDLGKALADITSSSDDEVISIEKVLSDLSNISEISVIDFSKIRSDEATIGDLFSKVVSFNRSITDLVLQPDLAALNITKPFADVIGYVDGPIQFDSDGWALDYVVSGYIFDTRVIFDVIKVVGDLTTAPDDDFYTLIKPLSEILIIDDAASITFTKVSVDAVSSFDDNPDIILGKVLSETQVSADSDFYDLAKVLADLVNPQDNDIINFVKIRVDESIILDDDIIAFTKVNADATINTDGPIQFDSDGWAVDYVVSGYIFDTRVVFDVIKVLSDSATQPDNDFYTLIKPLSESISSLDTLNTIDFVKSSTDESIILDDDIITFTKPLTEILINIDGPIQFDSDGWAVDYVVSGYIFDTRVVFDMTKPLSDTLPQPDDVYNWNVNKLLTDFNNQSDSNIIDFIKVVADSAVPLDNIDVFDGSTHSLAKVLGDFITPTESNIIDFAKVLSDSQTADSQTSLNISKSGLTDSVSVEDQTATIIQFNRNFADSTTPQDFANLTINVIFGDSVSILDSVGLELKTDQLNLAESTSQSESGKIITQNYIDHTYFADDYIGEVRLIA